MRPKKTSNIFPKVHKVFDQQTVNYNNGGGTQLHILSWLVNGKETPPVLERREFYDTETGRRFGKGKGLNQSDFEFILIHAREIGVELRMPAKLIDQALSESDKPDKTISEESEQEADW